MSDIPTRFLDPEGELDYPVKWADWLAGDTIATSTWEVPTGITKEDEELTVNTATIWLSAAEDAVVGQRYLVENHIETAQGRLIKQSFYVMLQGR